MEHQFLENSKMTNALKITLYEILAFIIAFSESPNLLKIISQKTGSNQYVTDKIYLYKYIGKSSVLLIYAPTFFIIILLFSSLLSGEVQTLIACLPLLVIPRIGKSIRNDLHRECPIFIQPHIKPVATPTLSSAPRNCKTLGDCLFGHPIKAIMEEISLENNQVLELRLDELNAFNLRDRLLILDIFFKRENSLSEIISKTSIQFRTNKNDLWTYFSEILNAPERNLREFANTSKWYKARIDQPNIINRLTLVKSFIEKNGHPPINLAKMIKMGSFG